MDELPHCRIFHRRHKEQMRDSKGSEQKCLTIGENSGSEVSSSYGALWSCFALLATLSHSFWTDLLVNVQRCKSVLLYESASGL